MMVSILVPLFSFFVVCCLNVEKHFTVVFTVGNITPEWHTTWISPPKRVWNSAAPHSLATFLPPFLPLYSMSPFVLLFPVTLPSYFLMRIEQSHIKSAQEYCKDSSNLNKRESQTIFKPKKSNWSLLNEMELQLYLNITRNFGSTN